MVEAHTGLVHRMGKSQSQKKGYFTVTISMIWGAPTTLLIYTIMYICGSCHGPCIISGHSQSIIIIINRTVPREGWDFFSWRRETVYPHVTDRFVRSKVP